MWAVLLNAQFSDPLSSKPIKILTTMIEENTTINIDQEVLQKMIDEAVEKKVNEKLSDFQAELTNAFSAIKSIKKNQQKEKVTILLTSFELDQILPAFIIATGAASFGMEATVFCTLWGINALKEKSIYKGKTLKEKMITMMLPDGPKNTTITRMNMLGIGTGMMKQMMKESNVETVPDMIELGVELGVKLMACQMTMGIMGVTRDELRDDIHYGGVATYIEEATESKLTLCF